MGGRSSRPDPYIEARKRSLRNQDIINNDIEISINDLRNKQKVLQDIINTKTVELANANILGPDPENDTPIAPASITAFFT